MRDVIKNLNFSHMTLRKIEATKLVAGIAILGMFALALISVAPKAQALSQSEVDLICTITNCDAATKTALQALVSGGTTTSSYTFTANLTTGANGEDVRQLQMFLNNKGYTVAATGAGSVGNESTYFGSATTAALAKFQAAQGIAPAVGYFGPITRNAVNGMMTTTTGTTTTTTTSTGLMGGAGSVDSYTIISSLSNEEVGEGQDDVEVAGLEIEVDDGSDIEIIAVKLVFDEGTAGSDFEDYASEVSITLDGVEVARVDADLFTDDNDWTKTISLDDAVIEEGETADLIVAVSGINNLDSGDAEDTWTVDFRQVRFKDADGATVSEDPTTAARTFSFEDFATATDVELKITSGDDTINDAHVINVDSSDDTDKVEIFSFELEAEGDSDIEVKDLPLLFTVTGATGVEDLINTAYIFVDGEEMGSESITSAATTLTQVFEDLDFVIDAGDTVEVVVKADFNSTSDDLDEGDTISVEIGETQTDLSSFDAEDEEGNNLSDANKTGSASSEASVVYDAGIMVTLVSTSETVATDDGSDDDTGTFVIKFLVEAFDGTVYIADTSAATVSSSIAETSLTDANGVLYLVEDSGTATTDDLADLLTESGDASQVASGNWELEDGESSTFTLTITQTNDSIEDDGLYRALLKSIGWNTTDSATVYNVYDFDLEDFKTDPISLN